MKATVVNLILLLSLILASCASRSGQLRDIDAIMEDDPGLALERLEQVGTAALSAADYPYYALLMTQAQIKNGVMVTSDTLMRHAYEAYRSSGNDNLRMRAHFYNAQIAYYRGDLRPAMADVVVAYDIAKAKGDPYWIAKTAEMISDIFFDAFNYQQAEAYEIECIENYEKAGRIDNHRYALADLATIYLAYGKGQRGYAVIDSLFNIITSEKPLDTALYNYAMVPMCSALMVTNQLDSLERMLPSRPTLSGPGPEFDYALTKSYLLDETDSRQLLWEAYKQAPDERNRARLLYATYLQALSAGNYKYAAEVADSLLIYQSKISEDVLKESVTGAQRDYFVTKSRNEASKSKSRLYIIIAVTAAAIIIVVLLMVIYRLRIREKEAELEANLSALMSMGEEVKRSNSEKERLNVVVADKSLAIENLFREQWGTLNMLCNEYFEMGDSESTSAALVSRIKTELQKIKGKKNLKEIEEAVDANMGGIMSLLREESKFLNEELKEDEFVFLSLIYAGLSVKAVCLFTDIKYKSFYQKRSRLIKRITDSTAPHRDLFVEKLR